MCPWFKSRFGHHIPHLLQNRIQLSRGRDWYVVGFRLKDIMLEFALPLLALTLATSALAQVAPSHDFVQKRYKIEGSAKVVTVNGVTQLVFSDDFKTKNGPDLKVYLTKKPIAELVAQDVVADSTKIGVLKSNRGEQTYVLPANLDLNTYESVVIHCEAFTVTWGGFDL